MTKVIYLCIDCGSSSTERNASQFKGKTCETYLCKRCSLKGERNPFYGKHHSPDSRKKISENHADVRGDKHPMFGKKQPTLSLYRKTHSLAGENNPMFGKHHTKESKKKIRANQVVLKGKYHPSWGKHFSLETRIKQSCKKLGIEPKDFVGFARENPYCVKFNKAFKERVRTFFGNTCSECHITKEENRINLSVHHVYYQKKACCTWDEEEGKYFTIINDKKYYIKGDPNKFVSHCKKCHSLTNTNRLYWSKRFEDLINEKYNGQCYLPRND